MPLILPALGRSGPDAPQALVIQLCRTTAAKPALGQPAPQCGPTDDFPRRARLYIEYRLTEADAMRKLTFGMNLSLDGYIAGAGRPPPGGYPTVTPCPLT